MAIYSPRSAAIDPKLLLSERKACINRCMEHLDDLNTVPYNTDNAGGSAD